MRSGVRRWRSLRVKNMGRGRRVTGRRRGRGCWEFKFVIAESYERIHRSNLVGMGILPLQFMPGQNVESLGLSGEELFAIGDTPGQLKAMLDGKFAGGKVITVFAESDLGKTTEFSATVRIDTPQEILYYQNGGILQYVLRQLAGKSSAQA